MQASIQLVDPNSSTWTINITDDSSGQSFQNNFVYASSQLSAEWIVERPTVNHVVAQLGNFGNVTFTNCMTTINSANGGISSFPATKIVMFSYHVRKRCRSVGRCF